MIHFGRLPSQKVRIPPTFCAKTPVFAGPCTIFPTTRDFLNGLLDRNGFAELDIREDCPRMCINTLYRYDPKDNALYPYFSDGYDNLIYFDGYLVTIGHDSGEHEYHLHKINKVGMRDIVAEDEYIVIEVSANRENDAGPANCSFFSAKPKQEYRRIKPPNTNWLQFCQYYGGTYRVN